VNPSLMQQFAKQRTEIIVARQRAEDERRRIARIERKIVKGFDPETMEQMLQAG
jgi:predicted dinucleotide-binding enzyme